MSQKICSQLIHFLDALVDFACPSESWPLEPVSKMRVRLRRGILGGDKAASSEHPRSPESFRDKERANAVPGQKSRRPQGFVAKAGLALLLLAMPALAPKQALSDF
jgi:hypothetical protein